MVCPNLDDICSRYVHGLDEWHHQHNLEIDWPDIHSFYRFILDLCGWPVGDEFFLCVLFGVDYYWSVY